MTLINSSSIRKYMIYAIGEIALVVIGILIALQINNWNELRKGRQQSLVYLENLKADFEDHLEKMNSTFDELEITKKCVIFVDDWVNGNTAVTDTFELIKSLNRSAYIINLRIQNSTWDEIISVGDLKLITNKQLKSHIASFENEYQMMAELDERKYNPVSIEYLKYSSNFFDVSNGYNTTSSASSFSEEGIWVDYEGLTGNSEISALLRRVFRSADEQQDFITTILEAECRKIIGMISYEIEQN